MGFDFCMLTALARAYNYIQKTNNFVPCLKNNYLITGISPEAFT